MSDWPDWPPEVREHLRKQQEAELAYALSPEGIAETKARLERQEAARQKRLDFSRTLITRLRWEWEHRDAEGRSVHRVARGLLKGLEWEAGNERRFWDALGAYHRDRVDEVRDVYPLAAVIRALNAVEAVSR
jgi:hypothetical protein